MKLETLNKEQITFSEVVDMWLNSKRIRIKQSTYDKYFYIIEKHINPCLGNILIEDVNSVLINSFLSNKLEFGRINDKTPLAPSYVSTMSIIINSAIHFAANENYCEYIKNPIYKPSSSVSQIRILNNNDYNKLIEEIEKDPDKTGTGILLALYAGLRIGEICALTWDNVDFLNNTLKIDSTITRINNNGRTEYTTSKPKTKASLREIPISKKLLTVLKSDYVQRKSKYVISANEKFVVPRTFENRYHKKLTLLDIEQLNFHSLRHTFATNCISKGMDVKSLSEILGHSNVNITLQVYVHSSMDLKRKQINMVFQ